MTEAKHKPKVRPPLSKDIELDFEIDIDGVKTGMLKMNRPTVESRIMSEKYTGTELNVEIIMIANLCDVPPEAIKGLYWSDYKKCQDAMRELMGFTLP